MRVRNRKGATELLEANPQYVVLNPADAKGKWQELFGNDHPIHIEVGSGKGAFITGMAKANPNINYIGIDIQKSVLSYALDKVLATDVPNIKLLWVDGSDLTNCCFHLLFGLKWSLQARASHFKEVLLRKRIWLNRIQQGTDNICQISCIIDGDSFWFVHKNT